MPSLLPLRRRIASVKNTQKITRAMQLVAASKMKKAQEAATKSRPFCKGLQAVIARALPSTTELHPLMQTHNQNAPQALVVVAADRGLCGAFNSAVLSYAEKIAKEKKVEAIYAIGKKAGRYFAGHTLRGEAVGHSDKPRYEDIIGISRLLVDDFLEGRVSKVTLVYTHFINTMSCKPSAAALLPFVAEEKKEEQSVYTFEPSAFAVLDKALIRYTEVLLWQGLLESNASEHSSRMIAMKAATDNANNLESELKLSMNKARQATITTEISEIVGGAAALENTL